jgi:aspartate carbamoyltransferase catalytic subunit
MSTEAAVARPVTWPARSHLVSIRSATAPAVEDLFALADQLAAGGGTPATGRIMATLFYEPSTRTRLSFESAMLRLGGQVLSTENAAQMSSAAKGESLRDTVRIVSGYADVIVLRHYEAGAAAVAAEVADVPVLNAGDGPGEHPTQALLDAYTIRRTLGRLDGVHLVLVGDMAYGRTAHSLSLLLAEFARSRVTFVAPPQAAAPAWLVAELRAKGVAVEESPDLVAAIRTADVLYMTRVQKERFSDPAQYELARGAYRLDPAALAALPQRAMVMHPLPRLDELPEAVDSDPRAVYFAQARSGVPVRMALLARALGVA